LAAWALTYELGDSVVRDRGILKELSALLKTPVANHGVVYRSNLFKTCIGYAMFQLKCDQEGFMSLVSWLLAFFFRHVVVAQPRQCIRDELMNFPSV
jgi:hypothetical protein